MTVLPPRIRKAVVSHAPSCQPPPLDQFLKEEVKRY
jgi:hypothetical protein